MRIVSLLPSATEIVCGLGLAEQLIGVTHECDYPPLARNKPKVTRTLIPTDASSQRIDALVREQLGGRAALYALDFEQMHALAPDLIVTQTLCDVCAVDDVEVRRWARQASSAAARDGAGAAAAPQIVYLEPTCLEDVLDNIRQVAEAAGHAARGRDMLEMLRERIERVRRAAAAARAGDRPRVVVLEWLDPLFSCGHWTPQLVEIAGGVEPLAQARQRSRQIDLHELLAADPDVLLIACCGFSVERSLQDVPTFLALPGVAALRCVRERRVYVVDGSAYFSRPGPRLVDSLEILAHAIDPQRHALPDGLPPPHAVTSAQHASDG
jgi:iron complex transport system substrate-binding protein